MKSIVDLPISSLVPYERNSRTHSPEQVAKIAASIKEFGFVSPVLIDADRRIIAGHGRIEAAKKLGLSTAPCIEVSGLSEAQLRAYIIADNKLAEDAGWDDDLLRLELSELAGMDFDLDLLGFTGDDINNFLGMSSGNSDPDDIPDLPDNPTAQLGDIYILGKHRLMCGDSTNAAHVAALLSGVGGGHT